MENKELFDLENEFFCVDKELEKEKSKRNFILIAIYTIIAIFITSNFFEIKSFKTIIIILVISLISGVVLWIVPLSIFQLVTEWFTNINGLDDRKKHLSERINNLRRK